MQANHIVAVISGLAIALTGCWRTRTEPSSKRPPAPLPAELRTAIKPKVIDWVVPVQEWAAVLREDQLRNFAPDNQMVTDRGKWSELWRAWRGDEAIPDVDFSEELVFVFTVGGPNQLRARLQRDGVGRISAWQQATIVGGPGFGYAMVRVRRAGITSLEDRPIPAHGKRWPKNH